MEQWLIKSTESLFEGWMDIAQDRTEISTDEYI